MTRTSTFVMACATQGSAHLFQRATLLGRSLQVFPEHLRPRLILLANNSGFSASGLASFYNHVIDQVDREDVVVFIHDDVFIHDWQLYFQLSRAFDDFDVVGVVGSAHVPYGQPGWWHDLDQQGKPIRNDAVIRSGSINHFDPNLMRPDWYGPSPMACDLLDGVFLAVRAGVLRSSGVRFDPQFQFHCYDSDFCYSALAAGLRIGTWPIPLTHGSAGTFGTSWIKAARKLQAKLAQAKP